MPDGPDDTRELMIGGDAASTASAFPGETGLALVPLKPSAEMLAAGTRAGEVSVEIAWRVYRAMIARGGQSDDDPLTGTAGRH